MPLLLLRYFFILARSYNFKVPRGKIDLISEAIDLLRLLLYNFLLGYKDKVKAKRRSRNPLIDSV